MKKTDKLIEDLIKKSETAQVKWMDIDKVFTHPDNPRTISKKDYSELKRSIRDFPEMMIYRPGIIDEDCKLIAGNMRHKACKDIGWSKFPVLDAKDLTPEQLKEFMIKDNLGSGDWDKEILKTDWDKDLLKEWGMDMAMFNEFSSKNQELEETEAPKAKGKHTLSFQFDKETYDKVTNFMDSCHHDRKTALVMMVDELEQKDQNIHTLGQISNISENTDNNGGC